MRHAYANNLTAVLGSCRAQAIRMSAAYGDATLLPSINMLNVGYDLGLVTVLRQRFFASWKNANSPLLGYVDTILVTCPRGHVWPVVGGGTHDTHTNT